MIHMGKTGIKKYFLALPAVIMLVLCNQTEADAQYCESDEILQAGGVLSGQEGTDEYINMSAPRYLDSVSALSVEQAIYNGLVLGSREINLQGYNLPVSDLEKVYVNVINDNADLFYVNRSWSYYSDSNGNVTRIVPSYSMNESERESARSVFNQEIETIMSQADGDWSDLEKALFYHDYICTHFEYDLTYSIYDAYNMLVEKKGVCQGYSLLYHYLLKQEGIRGSFASSDDMNHIWNIINIDGNWYHVDVTWDDPTQDAVGRSGHKNFLRSDEGIASASTSPHYNWTADYECTSVVYEDAFWSTIDAAFAFENGQWYCLNADSETINKCDVDTLSLGQSIYSFTDKWYTADGTGWWTGTYSGLGSYDGKVYFNTPADIYAYNTANGQIEQIYSPVLSGSEKIYGFYLDKNIIKYTAVSSPNEKRSVSGTYTLPEKSEIPESDISVKVDDATGNIVCSGKEITPEKLGQYFKSEVTVYNGSDMVEETDRVATGYTAAVQGTVYTIVVKGDVNGDCIINVLDMEAIQKDILKLNILSGAYLEAGKLNQEYTDSLCVMDMEIIQKYILGIDDIS